MSDERNPNADFSLIVRLIRYEKTRTVLKQPGRVMFQATNIRIPRIQSSTCWKVFERVIRIFLDFVVKNTLDSCII